MKYMSKFGTLALALSANGLCAPHLSCIDNLIVLSGNSLADDTSITFDNNKNIIEKIDPFNGFEAVDLGMTTASGKRLLWATCNVGATSPEQPGLYFAWGDTEGFTADEVSGKFSTDWYSSRPGAALTSDITADGGHDAARENMGGAWRLPTKAEITSLSNYGNRTWTTIGGASGYKIVNSSDSSKYIFLPAAGDAGNGSVNYVGRSGRYWSSALLVSPYSYHLSLYNGGLILNTYGYMYCGYSVRGVIEVD